MGVRVNIEQVSQSVLTALDGIALGDGEELRVSIEAYEYNGSRGVRQAVDIWKRPEPPVYTGKADAAVQKAFQRDVPLLKTQEERYVLGVVLEPLKEMGAKDSQDDTYSAAEVRQAAYLFMEDYGTLGLQHKFAVNGRLKLIENWIVREDTNIEGSAVKAGSWLMGIRVVDEDLWQAVKTGAITGFSIGGYARRNLLDSNAPAS